MLAGNHQQVHRTGVLQHLPVFGRQPGAIPQHQGCQARLAALGVHRHQTLADSVTPGMTSRRQALTILHRAGGTNAPGQQPGLLIKTVKVEQPGRPFQRYGQTPALATAYRRPTVPGHTDTLGQPGVARLAVGQLKTHTRLCLLRQPGYTAFQPSRLAIQHRP